MQTKYLSHKHGGKIVSVTAIAHETYRRVASWHYIGDVEWSDGSKSESTCIAPWAVCFDQKDDNAQREYGLLSEKLARYLETYGKWHDLKHTKDGRVYAWTPNDKQEIVSLVAIKV